MDEGSTGALVPAVVKSEGKLSSGLIAKEASGAATSSGGKVSEIGGGGAGELDKELLCPICMQMIKDAFLTVCGHSFCYMCIVTHLNNKNDCPCCATEENVCFRSIKNCLTRGTVSSSIAKVLNLTVMTSCSLLLEFHGV